MFVIVLSVFVFCCFCLNYVQVHPDLNRGDPSSKDKFLRLREAYTVLNSSKSRREYDEQLQSTRRTTASYSSHFTRPFTPPKQSTHFRYFSFFATHNGKEGKEAYSSLCYKHHTAMGTHVPYGITQYYLLLGRGDIPAFTPAN